MVLGLLLALGPAATGQDASARIKNQIDRLRQATGLLCNAEVTDERWTFTEASAAPRWGLPPRCMAHLATFMKKLRRP